MNRVKFISIFILLLISGSAFSQINWDYDLYEQMNHKNFRNNPMFSQTIDFNNPDLPLLNATLFFMTNEVRAKKRRKLLDYNKNLEIAAYQHSKSMVVLNFYSHINSIQPQRATPQKRGKFAGIKNPFIAENIAYADTRSSDTYLEIAEFIMDLWMKSPNHKSNILSKDALELGCGAYFSENRVFATQNFQWYEMVIETEAEDSLPDTK
ncbi:MAG: CAP domain-containing protein [Bacteroidota bacterium]